MEINLLVFGQLTDITGTTNLRIEDVEDTNGLEKKFTEHFPEAANFKYRVAVNKVLINNNTLLNNNDTVAFLPPFSGG